MGQQHDKNIEVGFAEIDVRKSIKTEGFDVQPPQEWGEPSAMFKEENPRRSPQSVAGIPSHSSCGFGIDARTYSSSRADQPLRSK